MSQDVSLYDSNGVRFLYPTNWEVQETEVDEAEVVMVTSPEESYWLLALYPAGTDSDEAAKKFLGIMTGEYEKLENSPIKRYFGEWVLYGYEMNFFYMDLTSSALVLGLEDEERTYIIFWQTCDRLAISDEELSCSDVFEAMTSSFLKNLEEE